MSYATDLVPGDTNGLPDVFVRDLQTGTTVRASVASSPSNAQGNGPSGLGGLNISADGHHVAFTSHASNFVSGDRNGVWDVFVRDLRTGTTSRVSVSSAPSNTETAVGATSPSISDDGRHVAFVSSGLTPADLNNTSDVFVRDRQTGATTMVSVSSSGVQANYGSATAGPSVSATGRFVAFQSNAFTLAPGDTNGLIDAFLRDRDSDRDGIYDEVGAVATERVSTSMSTSASETDGNSADPSVSADGRYVVYISDASNLVGGDNNGASDVFLRDREAGKTTVVSVSRTPGIPPNGDSASPGISNDGRYISFASDASDLVDGDSNRASDVFLTDRSDGSTRRVSVANSGAQGSDRSFRPDLSARGTRVVFDSLASNLTPDDRNSDLDVFLWGF